MKIEPVALRELAESDMFSMTEVFVALNSAADTIDTLRAEIAQVREAYLDRTVDCYSPGEAHDVMQVRVERAEAEADALRKVVSFHKNVAASVRDILAECRSYVEASPSTIGRAELLGRIDSDANPSVRDWSGG
ncbi:hypothetical protein [Luteimonas saliphila]|uniref:hypothetical protein n=1 Tax=Luteimonas saliphila TaxID=2804919 RepID=UPI00192DC575|nr:hypothetical protein [Luteimonas saliphila]